MRAHCSAARRRLKDQREALVSAQVARFGARRPVGSALIRLDAAIGPNAALTFPERDVALRLSRTISNSDVLDHVVLAPGFGLVELAAPSQFIGKTLKELDLSNRFSIQMVFAKRSQSEEVILPRADFIVRPNDTLVFIGRDEDLRKLDDLPSKIK